MASDNNVIPLHPLKPDPTFGDRDNVTGKYILVDRVPVECPELLKWGMWMENFEDRRVAETEIEGVRISTVFLGLDHSYSFAGRDRKTPPVLFETMIFGGEHDEEQWRYCTWDEAEEGHAKAVLLGTEGKKSPSQEWLRAKLRRSIRWLRKDKK
jgi:hypothetical protein